MKNIYLFLPLIFILINCKSDSLNPIEKLHVVFVTGDEEYRSEESMPMLARLLQDHLDAEVTICFALDSAGIIDPNRSDHISGLAALETADLMVLFTRFRALPEEELKFILDYAESGKPMVGFRTSTHAFLYPDDSTKAYLFDHWPVDVFGQKWITHHGHFEDGAKPLTKVQVHAQHADHPILRGVEPFSAYSWLYHVDGGEHTLNADTILLEGTSLRSKHQEDGNLDKFPLTNPVAWTKYYQGKTGLKARVFFTTLGHPYDFKETSMRRLALQGIFWALNKEEHIPSSGFDVQLDFTYEPNNSGFGQKYKPGLTPEKATIGIQ